MAGQGPKDPEALGREIFARLRAEPVVAKRGEAVLFAATPAELARAFSGSAPPERDLARARALFRGPAPAAPARPPTASALPDLEGLPCARWADVVEWLPAVYVGHLLGVDFSVIDGELGADELEGPRGRVRRLSDARRDALSAVTAKRHASALARARQDHDLRGRDIGAEIERVLALARVANTEGRTIYAWWREQP